MTQSFSCQNLDIALWQRNHLFFLENIFFYKHKQIQAKPFFSESEIFCCGITDPPDIEKKNYQHKRHFEQFKRKGPSIRNTEILL